jgi:hypothetical protein
MNEQAVKKAEVVPEITSAQYKKDLEGQTVATLREKYEKVTGVRAPSKFNKAALVNELVAKFIKLGGKVELPQESVDVEEKKVTAKDRGSRANSRRGTIIRCLREGIWDRETLAKHLNELNPEEWPIERNKAAITGTIADLRRNKGAKIETGDDGRLILH